MKYRKLGRNSGGFTLIELIVSLTIAGIIIGLLARFLVMGFRTYSFMDTRKQLLRDARLALHFMNRDFRQIRNTNGVAEADVHRFRYWDYNNNQYIYSVQNGRLLRNGHTVADGISSFQFRYRAADGHQLQTPVAGDSLDYIWNVEADFVITKGQYSQRYHVFVHPRNY
ncbi:MAG TPA: prepilin-type N-terminal cleavage/methylation domain-containing protein [Bacteroidetes bacterium]|nr:prepilin-type N-terminal cleavage/methylation domain-containing protein [Bacteroidota bacterium]